jgi:hypothetical protein
MTPATTSSRVDATSAVRRLQQQARARRSAIAAATGLPWIAVAALGAWRFGGVVPAIVVAMLGAVVLAVVILRHRRAIDRAWLVRALDAGAPALQDSADLLFADRSALGPLQAMQRLRVEHSVTQLATMHLREPWPSGQLRLGALLAIALSLMLCFWPDHHAALVAPITTSGRAVDQSPPVQALQATLRIEPPAYTGKSARQQASFDAQVEQGSLLTWTLRFGVAPSAARLRFVDGEALTLTRAGDDWTAQRAVESSTLYRIEFDGAPALPESAPFRLDVTPDLAPRLKVLQPERTLTMLDDARARWQLVIEAEDDYALGAAQLEITLAQGSGEQVTVSERKVMLRGKGDALHQRYEHRFDLAGLGFAQGDDLIARVLVRDQRVPAPNITRSASFILRWPPDVGMEGSGVEGLVQQAMPAYFRSQRQIIIDTEALLAMRPTLSADDATVRSDVIGTDQRLLRLRYGQFLGEESETVEPSGGEHEHGQDEPGAAAPADARQSLMAAAGHLHDLPEAATLLDPETRKLLRGALDEMWQAERELRTGNTAAALPYEYRALDFIKRVQQADRIYLARVGLELPQLDAARRLTGQRPASALRADALVPFVADDAAIAMWHALGGAGDLPLDDLARWVASQREETANPLALLAEIDALRRDRECIDCRQRLAALLWPSLAPPAAAPQPRARPDAVGRAYLEALAPVEASP